jgi:capsid protein
MMLTTLEELAAEEGKDWRDIVDQREQEAAYLRSKGLDPEQVQLAAMNAKPTATVAGSDQPTVEPKDTSSTNGGAPNGK